MQQVIKVQCPSFWLPHRYSPGPQLLYLPTLPLLLYNIKLLLLVAKSELTQKRLCQTHKIPHFFSFNPCPLEQNISVWTVRVFPLTSKRSHSPRCNFSIHYAGLAVCGRLWMWEYQQPPCSLSTRVIVSEKLGSRGLRGNWPVTVVVFSWKTNITWPKGILSLFLYFYFCLCFGFFSLFL